ncbi:MAG: hypothetical protein HC800_22200 [Phormidesmis sp. RL_2_1]|nr:hypothetical protein [Phormidesmis sp. RL_2_1]
MVFLGIGLAFSLATRVNAQVAIPQEIPESIHGCINSIEPPSLVRAVDVAGTATVENTDYYYLYAYDQEVPDNPEPASADSPNWVAYPSDLVISLQSDRCEIERLGTPGDHIDLASVVSQVAARSLTLNRFERVIEVIGRENFIARVDSWDTGDGQYSLWDEEAWALNQLDIDIPEGLLP